MKSLMLFIGLLALLTGCQSQPTFIDNGNPGQINAVIFYDDNRNGVLDTNETGAQTEVSFSQDISCPPSRKDTMTFVEADVNGRAQFKDLKPGKYCVHPVKNFGMTTKQNLEIYVSSDEVVNVFFGIVRE